MGQDAGTYSGSEENGGTVKVEVWNVLNNVGVYYGFTGLGPKELPRYTPLLEGNSSHVEHLENS